MSPKKTAASGRRRVNGTAESTTEQSAASPPPPPPPPPAAAPAPAPAGAGAGEPYRLKTRPLTGAMGFPLVMLSGEDYGGKTAVGLAATLDDRIGESYVLALGELVDHYAELARPDTQFVLHDGSWREIWGAVTELDRRSRQLREAGEKPLYLLLDSGTKLWELLWTWVEFRAANSAAARIRLRSDHNASIDTKHHLWNAAHRRHRKLVATLLTMPAIVVVTAREKLVTPYGPDREPVPGASREWKTECHPELPYASTCYVRLSKTGHPEIVGLRRARGGIQVGKDEPLRVDPESDQFKEVEFSVPWLVFDWLGFDPDTAEVPQLIEPAPDAGADDTMPRFPVGDQPPPGADETPGASPQQVVSPQPAARRG